MRERTITSGIRRWRSAAMLRQILSAFANWWTKEKRQNRRNVKPDLKTLIITAGCPEDLADGWRERVSNACAVYSIGYGPRLAAFLAQVGHESDSFRRTIENLNYSEQSLRKVFGRYFPTDESAQLYARNPEKIANRVYANRMGNGPEESGEGWKYRGRGLIQLTGKENVREFSLHFYSDERLVDNPDRLADNLAAMSAGWFWQVHALNVLADKGDFEGITKAINGGTTGIEDRISRWENLKTVMGI